MYVRNTVSYFLEVDLTSSLRPCLLDGGKYRLSQSWGFTWTLAKMLIFFFFAIPKYWDRAGKGCLSLDIRPHRLLPRDQVHSKRSSSQTSWQECGVKFRVLSHTKACVKRMSRDGGGDTAVACS